MNELWFEWDQSLTSQVWKCLKFVLFGFNPTLYALWRHFVQHCVNKIYIGSTMCYFMCFFQVNFFFFTLHSHSIWLTQLKSFILWKKSVELKSTFIDQTWSGHYEKNKSRGESGLMKTSTPKKTEVTKLHSGWLKSKKVQFLLMECWMEQTQSG